MEAATTGQTALAVTVALRHGTAHAALGADSELEEARRYWRDADRDLPELRAIEGMGAAGAARTQTGDGK